jgi:hypothetical protein
MDQEFKDEYQQAFLAYRRQHGLNAAMTLIKSHGGEDLQSVPEAKRADLLKAFKAGARFIPDNSEPPVAKLDPDAIYRKWNSAGAGNGVRVVKLD